MFDALLHTSPYAKKSVPAELKATGSKGEFTATFSVFDNLDYQGDVVRKGAFGPAHENDPEPAVVYSHRWDIPPIGATLEWAETAKGAKGTGQLFVDEHEVAKQTYAAMKAGALKEFSFAYDVAEGGYVLREAEDDEKSPRWDDMVRELTSLERVFEWGPTIAGANPETVLESGPKALEALTGVRRAEWRKWLLDEEMPLDRLKALAVDLGKSGARNAKKDAERLQEIHDLSIENGAKCAKEVDEPVDEPVDEEPEKALTPEQKKRAEEMLADVGLDVRPGSRLPSPAS